MAQVTDVYALLTSAPDGCGDEHYVPVTLLRERVRGTHLKGCWVCPRLGLDVLTKMRVPEPSRNQPRSSNPYPLILLTAGPSLLVYG
jgi:hypothetical protein